jgi:hypothetical protein
LWLKNPEEFLNIKKEIGKKERGKRGDKHNGKKTTKKQS